jgi:hypothetical protein
MVKATKTAPGHSGSGNGGNMAEERGGSAGCSSVWEHLEEKYTLEIEGNKAIAWLGGKRVVEVTAIPGTDDANVLIDFGFDPSTSVSNMKIKAPQKFTASNLAAELKRTCLFILAQMEMALAAVAAEDN